MMSSMLVVDDVHVHTTHPTVTGLNRKRNTTRTSIRTILKLHGSTPRLVRDSTRGTAVGLCKELGSHILHVSLSPYLPHVFYEVEVAPKPFISNYLLDIQSLKSIEARFLRTVIVQVS